MSSFGEPVDHCRRALLIGLHRQPEALPGVQRWVGQHRRNHLEREFETVGFLGIDGEVEVEVTGEAGEFEQPRHELGADSVAAKPPRSADAERTA